MNLLIAPNALKGSLSALQAAEIIARSLPNGWNAKLCPIADGGDGTLDCLLSATGGHYFNATVTGPLAGMNVDARWGVLGNSRIALIEMAEASGLRLLKPAQYSAARTTTFGVGELILRAIDEGYRKILVGLGGSSTNDGGSGCATALGVRLLDKDRTPLAPGGIHLRELQTIDISGIDRRVLECEIVCLSDVNNLLLGPAGATRMFGSQKGATPGEIESLEAAMNHYSRLLLQQVYADVTSIVGGGAAGGLGAGLVAFCQARIVSGIDYVLDLVGFDRMLSECDAVVTAEGSVDEQTVRGKGIAGIALRARKAGKPVHVFAGRVKDDPQILCRQLGVDSIHEISPPDLDEKVAIRKAGELLGAKAASVFLSWQ